MATIALKYVKVEAHTVENTVAETTIQEGNEAADGGSVEKEVQTKLAANNVVQEQLEKKMES